MSCVVRVCGLLDMHSVLNAAIYLYDFQVYNYHSLSIRSHSTPLQNVLPVLEQRRHFERIRVC